MTTEEQYRGTPSRMIENAGVLSLSNADDRSWEQTIRRWKRAPSDYVSDLDARVAPELERLLADEVTTERFCAAARLGFVAMPDDEFVRWFDTFLLGTLGDSFPDHRVVLVNFSQQVHTRAAFVRALFVADNSPAWFTTPGEEPSLSAMRGIVGDALQGSTRLIDPFLLVTAPWTFGT